MEPSIELFGLTIHSPVTAFTNVLLSLQCVSYYRRLRTGRPDRSGYWALFFLAMASAAAAGAPKHGLWHVLSTDVFTLVLWISSVGSAAAVYYAQRATLASRAAASPMTDASHGRDRTAGLCRLQAALFLGASLALGPEMWLVIVNTAVGLVPVIAAEAHFFRLGAARGAWVVAGLSVSLFTGVVYLGRFSFSVWFDHVGIAHVFMGLSFWLIARGAPNVVGCRGAAQVPALAASAGAVGAAATDFGGTT